MAHRSRSRSIGNGIFLLILVFLLSSCSDILCALDSCEDEKPNTPRTDVIPLYVNGELDVRNLEPGFELQMEVSGGKPPYTWVSNDISIASIDSDTGYLIAVKDGVVTVTATDSEMRTGSVDISISVKILQSISIASETVKQINAGSSLSYVVTGLYTDSLTGVNSSANIRQLVNWTALPVGLADFSGTAGNLTTRLGASGTVTIRANFLDFSDSVSLDITPSTVEGLSVSSSLKTLSFNWMDTPGATEYKLLRSYNNDLNYFDSFPSVNKSSIAIDRAVHLLDWDLSTYLIKACDVMQSCVLSSPITVPRLEEQLVNYVKTPNAKEGDMFGGDVSMSRDGSIVAVGAAMQNSAASGTGFDGNQQDDCYIASGTLNPNPVNCAINSGAVYLYQRERMPTDNKRWTAWQLVSFIKAPSAAAGDRFGYSVSLSADGSTLAVGAPGDSSAAASTGLNGNPIDDCSSVATNCANESGAVYVIQSSVSGSGNFDWSQGEFTAYLKSPSASAGDWFGNAISISGDGAVLAVGVFKEDSGQIPLASNTLILNPDDCYLPDGSLNPFRRYCEINSGAAFLFQTMSTLDGKIDWKQGNIASYFKAYNASAGDEFGNALSLSADASTLVIGAHNNSALGGGDNDCYLSDGVANPAPLNCLQNSGAVYFYENGKLSFGREDWRLGRFLYELKADNPNKNEEYGWGVSLSGNALILAVSVKNHGSGAVRGIFDFYTGNDCYLSDGSLNPLPSGCLMNSGAVLIYRTGLSLGVVTWSTRPIFLAQIKAPNASAYDSFGYSIDLNYNGDTLAVGAAYQNSDNGNLVDTLGGSLSDCPDPIGLPNTTFKNCKKDSGAVYLFQSPRYDLAAVDPYSLAAFDWLNGNIISFIKAPNAGESDNYGGAVSLSGNGEFLAVGAMGESSASASTGFNGDPLDDCKLPDGSANSAAVNCAPSSGAIYLY